MSKHLRDAIFYFDRWNSAVKRGSNDWNAVVGAEMLMWYELLEWASKR